MKVFRNNEDISISCFKNPVVAIGNFDGCHIGHQQIFQRTRANASRIGGETIVYTFDPHPALIIKGVTPQLIFTLEEKIEAIRCLGMDSLVIAPFTREFANTDPEVFVKEVIVEKMGARGVVVGHDFAFGKKAAGNIPFLTRMGKKYGFFVESVAAVSFEGTVISSTCIRKMILSGDVGTAAKVMKYPFRIKGPVVRGKARGRELLGFPTANVLPDKELIPAYGVYAVYITIEDKRFDGVVNIGNNPTFGDVGTSIEVFIFDLDEDLYGKEVSVEFIEHIRGEIKFADKEYLIEQINADCDAARQILSRRDMRENLRNI